jgi:hypothetical protein
LEGYLSSFFPAGKLTGCCQWNCAQQAAEPDRLFDDHPVVSFGFVAPWFALGGAVNPAVGLFPAIGRPQWMST